MSGRSGHLLGAFSALFTAPCLLRSRLPQNYVIPFCSRPLYAAVRLAAGLSALLSMEKKRIVAERSALQRDVLQEDALHPFMTLERRSQPITMRYLGSACAVEQCCRMQDSPTISRICC